MMKKVCFSIFIVLFFGICLVPLVCMLFQEPEKAVGNEMQVELPSVKTDDGKVNEKLMSDFGNWFEHHFAFRPQMITADAKIQQAVFRVSGNESVVTGTDGWLYYASTLDDYLGRNTLSVRGMWNLTHNLHMIEAYTQQQGAEFLLMVPPNKNSLYPEHMPYYLRAPENAAHNRDKLAEELEKAGVNYLDLFALFGQQDEVLYFKQDSHWNAEGARMVYHEALVTLGKEHEDYSRVPVQKKKDHHGDLSAMLYPASGEAEFDSAFAYEQNFRYETSPNAPAGEVSVEDHHIETTNSKADGSLLMYRDSFGNSLVPFFANAYETAVFSRTVPYNLAADLEKYRPDHVVVEKVERNLRDFVTEPAVIPAPVADMPAAQRNAAEPETFEMQLCPSNMNYVSFRGELPANGRKTDGRIYLGISGPSGEETVYEAFTVCTDSSDYGFLAYLPLVRFGSLDSIDLEQIRVYTD